MTLKVTHDPLVGEAWIIVDNNDNVVASGFDDEAEALSLVSLLEESDANNTD